MIRSVSISYHHRRMFCSMLVTGEKRGELARVFSSRIKSNLMHVEILRNVNFYLKNTFLYKVYSNSLKNKMEKCFLGAVYLIKNFKELD